MGVDDLWKFCIPGNKSKDPQHFKSAANTKIAVDASYLLHSFISRQKNALAICSAPSHPLSDVMSSLESHHKGSVIFLSLKSANLSLSLRLK